MFDALLEYLADMLSYTDVLKVIGKLNTTQKEIIYSRLLSERKKPKKIIIDSRAETIVPAPIKRKHRSIIDEDANKLHSNVECCLHCGSLSIKKIGKTSGGMQRYFCKDCRKSFSENYGLITHYTHLAEWQWKEAVRATIQGDSLTNLAQNIGVSTKTAWLCRMKIYQTIKNIYGYCDTFNNIVEVDGKYERISFKGLKNKDYFINTLKRMPRHHMSRQERIEYLGSKYQELFINDPELLKEMLFSNQKRMVGRDTIGNNHQHVCVLTAVDRINNIYIEPITAGSPKSQDIYAHLADKMSIDAILVTDEHHGYKQFSKSIGLEHIIIKRGSHVNKSFSLARVNALHSSVDRFLKTREYHPATKYLDLYLMMFWWLEKNKDVPTNDLCNDLFLKITGSVTNEHRYNMKKVIQSELTARPLPIDHKGYY